MGSTDSDFVRSGQSVDNCMSQHGMSREKVSPL